MKKVYSTLALLLITPIIASAQSLQTMIPAWVKFLNDVIIPFLLAIAFLFFVINVVRFFVIGGSNEEGQEKAKGLAIYSVSAFVIIVVFWGIINMLVSSFGLGGCSQPIFDYKEAQPGYAGPPAPDC
ncbi:MAG: hypothetical protein RLZZ230_334 [Candidatus Parcubacteria bacterium]|jgi:cbb3-type cytochrome oxidase subunit 1